MLLQEQLEEINKSGSPIQSFVVPVAYQDLIFLATSADVGFYAARITPLYATSGGDVPGDPIDLAINEYVYLSCTESPLKIRVDCPIWLSNLNLKIWRGLPDDPRPEAHEHSNKPTIDNFTESDNKLFYKNQQIPDHSHNNVVTLEKISESEGKLFFNNFPVANHHHNDLALLNLLTDVDGKLYYNYNPVYPVPSSLHEHDNLGILSQISALDGQLLFNEQPIGGDMTEVITAIDNQTTILNTKLNDLQTSINNLSIPSEPHTITFTPLTLSPTYQVYSNTNWTTAPQDLQALYDNDVSSASNLFTVGGNFWVYGEVIMFPGISIPQYTRIKFKVGIRNSNNGRALFELSFFNIALSSYINAWNYLGFLSSSQDLIVNIEVIINFSWDKMKWKMYDVGDFFPQARFYDLIVEEMN